MSLPSDEIGRKTELNDFDHLISRYRKALAELARWGVRVSPHSRLRVYERRLASVGSDPSVPVESEVAMQLMFDLREIDEITEIVESFRRDPNPVEREKLQAIASGAEHPDEERQSAARDTQYELYLRTFFARSPARPVLGEPDLLVTWKSVQFAVEAKRPKSLSRFDDNLRKAVSQLDAGPQPGIVAVSLDQALRPPRNHLSVPWPEQMAEVPSALIARFLVDNQRIIDARTLGRNVAGLLFTLRIPAQVQSTGHASLATGIHVHPIPGARAGDLAVELLTAVVSTAESRDSAGGMVPKVGRNEHCPCGSGIKYKNCHGKPSGAR